MEIKTCLNILGLEQKNNGTSTGSISFSSSESIDSISPVDGKKIGSVGETSLQDYNKVIETAANAFKFGLFQLCPSIFVYNIYNSSSVN